MPDQILHSLTTERGTYRLVSPRDDGSFAYITKDADKVGEIYHADKGLWLVSFYRPRASEIIADAGKLCLEFEASYLARV